MQNEYAEICPSLLIENWIQVSKCWLFLLNQGVSIPMGANDGLSFRGVTVAPSDREMKNLLQLILRHVTLFRIDIYNTSMIDTVTCPLLY